MVKRLVPTAVSGLERTAPFTWRSGDDDPGFVFDVSVGAAGFVGFFLMTSDGGSAPRITFDDGAGYSEITALNLKAFPFAFYHIALDRTPPLRRLRFRPRDGAGAFRFFAFRTSNAILVAALHYLFNLRYQNIGIVAPDAKGRANRWTTFKATAARLVRFFRDVSKGGGVRAQQGAEDMLPALKAAMSAKAVDLRDRLKNEVAASASPLISFVAPTWNTRQTYLHDLVTSYAGQEAPYAELILSDDGSTDPEALARLRAVEGRPGIGVVMNPVNRGIAAATNAGIAAARGRWIAFIDHDDVFVPGAVAVIADAILRNPDAIFFYTDEIIVDDVLKPIGSFCKPAFDSVMLSGVNYINHFSVFRADRLAAIGNLREDREGSQDYDLLLRYLAGVTRDMAVHIPYPAYLWRRGEGSYSAANLDRSVASARHALAGIYGPRATSVEPALLPGLHRVRLAQPRHAAVSVVVPNRDSLALIERTVGDLTRRTNASLLEIIIVDNGTTDPAVLDFYRTIEGAAVRVDIVPEPFNFARMCNRGARLAKGDAILFFNNDLEVIEPEWLGEMVECLSFGDVGIVGAKLTYPNGKVQHNGVIVGLGQAAGHWYVEASGDEPGPMGRFAIRQTLSAVTAACMLVTKRCFDAIGGFDEDQFAIAYNDVDLCLRARNAGFRTIWTPFAHLVHLESVTRGSDETGPQNARFRMEAARLQDRHGTSDFIDDAYSPFYDRRHSHPFITIPDVLPALRPNRFG